MFFKLLTRAAALVGFAAILSAQAIDPETFKVNYFSNVGTGIAPAQVQLTNVGTSGGNICADIYVFDPNQELEECCSCQLTPDGLRTLVIGPSGDIAANPLRGFPPPFLNGTIKIVSSSGTCSGSGLPLPVSPKPTPGLRAWATHLNGPGVFTETAFSDAELSAGELSSLGTLCAIIKKEGSGAGVCSCGSGEPAW
jgi:hypothetical protein